MADHANSKLLLNLEEVPAPLVPVVFAKGDEACANSRDVSRFFDKNHRDVMRAIDILVKAEPDLGLRNFTHTPFVQPTTGQTYRCFDMTRDGFTLLAMGFTGTKALRWKIRYIDAFNAMEASLRAKQAVMTPDMMAAFGGVMEEIIQKQISRILPDMVASALAADPRRAVMNYISVRQLLEDGGAVQKGRRGINRKMGYDLKIQALLERPQVPVLKCPHSGVWLYPRTFATNYMAARGAALIRSHNDKARGQGRLKLVPTAGPTVR